MGSNKPACAFVPTGKNRHRGCAILADILLQAKGCTLVWSAPFRQAMKVLCAERGLPATLPTSVAVSTVRGKGLLLVRPAQAGDTKPVPVHMSPGGRRISTTVPEAFAELNIALPDGIVIEVPVIFYTCPRNGLCLALQFQQGNFLYRLSKGSAIGLQDDE